MSSLRLALKLSRAENSVAEDKRNEFFEELKDIPGKYLLFFLNYNSMIVLNSSKKKAIHGSKRSQRKKEEKR
jgi:hypothetical protein